MIPAQRLERIILLIRGRQVILDRDLAELYGVQTKVLVQAVKRNMKRFPADFMFHLTQDELELWRSHIVTSNSSAKMGLRRRPFAFTEQGVAMLSSVLHSDRAIAVNIEIMRTFVHLRQLLATHKTITSKVSDIQRRLAEHDLQFKTVFAAIQQLMKPPGPKAKRLIGFRKRQ